jgi:hypothetical protein
MRGKRVKGQTECGTVPGNFLGFSFSIRSSPCPCANEPPGGQEEKTAD